MVRRSGSSPRDTMLHSHSQAGALSATPPAVVRYLPPFFSSVQIAETPLWKWLALIIAALLLLALSRQFDPLLAVVTRKDRRGAAARRGPVYVPSGFWRLSSQCCVILSLLAFRAWRWKRWGPSAIARLYIGRAAQVLFVWSDAWCLMRLVELFLSRVESNLWIRGGNSLRGRCYIWGGVRRTPPSSCSLCCWCLK